MHTFRGIIKFLIITGLGIILLGYLISTQFWKDFKEPVQLSHVSEMKTGTIVEFTTELENTGFQLYYSDGTPSYYFYQGFLNEDMVMVLIHKNYLHQITKKDTDQYSVIGKVLEPDKEAVEYFGKDMLYVELLREGYKGDTIKLLLFSLFLIGIGSIIPIFLIQQKKK